MVLDHGGQALAAQLFVAQEPGLYAQAIAEQRQTGQFTNEVPARAPYGFTGWLNQQPGSEPRSALGRCGGVEQMQERMRAQKIEVAGVQMALRRRSRRLKRRPVQAQSSQVPPFDVGPDPEPVNPMFEPVMIRRDDEKSDEKRGDGAVPRCRRRSPRRRKRSTACSRAGGVGDERFACTMRGTILGSERCSQLRRRMVL